MTPSNLTFWQHAAELRLTLLKCLITIIFGLIVSLFYTQEIFTFLQSPLSSTLKTQKIIREQITNESSVDQLYILPNNARVTSQSPQITFIENIATIPPHENITIEKFEPSKLLILGPLDGIMIVFKVCFFIGLLATSPITLYFILNYIAPALNEKFYRLMIPFIGLSLLFITFGASFAFFCTIPIANQYLTLFNQEIGLNVWSLSNYLDYTILLLIGNALSFEIGVIAIFLVHFQVINHTQLKAKRRIFIVFAFIIGALLTPPDIFTQAMLAIPLILIYEGIIIYAKVLHAHRLDRSDRSHRDEHAIYQQLQ